MRHRSLFAAALLSCTTVAASASGDQVTSTRFDLRETVHAVEVKVDRGVATLVVTRAVQNSGPRSDQALFFLDIPTAAVATRLRTQGRNARGEPIWFEGDLMEAETAAHKYQELTGIGGYYPKDPALLSWRHQGFLALQVFPVPAGAEKTVEYTMKMPLAYEDGRYTMTLPPLGTELHRAKVKVSAAHEGDRVLVSGMLAQGTFDAAQPTVIELRPAVDEKMRGAIASVPLGSARHLVHVALDAAPAFGRVPAYADVAIVIDGSHSMASSFSLASTAARAYLSHLPNANVHVTTFDRAVRTPFGVSVPVRDAITKLYGLQSPDKNGSQLDDALADADGWLAQSQGAVRRVLVLTDLRTRDALTPAVLARKLGRSGAIVHVATVDSGEAELTRDDDDAWAQVPRKTGGLLYRATIPERLEGEAQRRVFLEWVRPIRLQHVAVVGAPSALYFAEEIKEGQRFEHLGIDRQPAGDIGVTGELWSRAVSLQFTPSESEGRLWSGLVFGSSLMHELSEAEMMLLATKGGAVSPVTSYLAIEPGVRPSTEGLEPQLSGTGEGGGGTGQGIGLGSIGSIGHGGGSSFDADAVLRAAIADALRACGAHGTRAEVHLETTVDEIVDVASVTLTPGDPKAAHCVSERMWDVRLPSGFDSDHATYAAIADAP